ncbi:type II toxin-antitoxin system RelE/ParE family toxin [Streptococcus himalayensis]|uniref:Addiction module toxin RelE n=1 Tax=Streptococcus himalayensis TaxID=1888195 RepID=A0A917A4J5_9STRE|nr:type II toxin-antitoxin system RelE/ParE family toxin [Streptococcus himalayensis]QBX16538.1 toxin to DNA-damage-inducible protein J [Streptococcus phage Javan255]GGE26936.1 addiction module toxin RelE [Streptococcus himalayensis]
MDKYLVKVPNDIFDQIESIRDYIKNVLLSEQSAENTVKELVKGLRSLEVFPERGFDADAKVNTQISQNVKTRGILVANNRYIIFYSIDEKEKVVNVSHLLPSKSDYAKLFL